MKRGLRLFALGLLLAVQGMAGAATTTVPDTEMAG